MDVLWRRRAAELVQGWKPQRILDLATGSGDVALTLRAACPEATLVGADFCVPMLREAQRKAFRTVIAADGMRLPCPDGTFDVVTVAFGLRNMADYGGALREMRRVLRPGGHLLVLDFSIPPAPFRWIYRPYLHYALPRIAGWLTGERSAYQYLGESIEQFPAGNTMTALMRASGFATAEAEPLTGGIVSIYTAGV